jgi:hypothetical protein
MRESFTYGSVRGAGSNPSPYRDRRAAIVVGVTESQTGTEHLDGDYPRPSLENPRPRGVLCPHGHRRRLCPDGPR